MHSPLLRTCSFIALLPLTVLLTGCGDKLNCSADESQQLVKQIARADFDKRLWPNQKVFLDFVSFSLSDIITVNQGETKTSCKARLRTVIAASEQTPFDEKYADITFSMEKTDDGRLYITVFGLHTPLY